MEGNLIVFENDAISVTPKQIHVLIENKMKKAPVLTFEYKGYWGKGHFAQAFRQLWLRRGNWCGEA
jgi:hypothetical protein